MLTDIAVWNCTAGRAVCYVYSLPSSIAPNVSFIGGRKIYINWIKVAVAGWQE